jgi:hypothetical protein
LIENGYLERCADFDYDGKKVLANRLGWRMTSSFVRTFFGRVFNYPHAVFTEEILRPEKQDKAVFADGMDNIVGTHKEVAEKYFADGSVAWACPPLQALLHIMAHGRHEGRGPDDAGFRALFTRENILASNWYAARLSAKQEHDIRLWRAHAAYLENFLKKKNYTQEASRLGIPAKLEAAWATYHKVKAPAYLAGLKGTIGLQPLKAESQVTPGFSQVRS